MGDDICYTGKHFEPRVVDAFVRVESELVFIAQEFVDA